MRAMARRRFKEKSSSDLVIRSGLGRGRLVWRVETEFWVPGSEFWSGGFLSSKSPRKKSHGRSRTRRSADGHTHRLGCYPNPIGAGVPAPQLCIVRDRPWLLLEGRSIETPLPILDARSSRLAA